VFCCCGPFLVNAAMGSLLFLFHGCKTNNNKVCYCGPFLVNGATSSLLSLFHHCKTNNNNEVHTPTYFASVILNNPNPPTLPLPDHYVILTLLVMIYLLSWCRITITPSIKSCNISLRNWACHLH